MQSLAKCAVLQRGTHSNNIFQTIATCPSQIIKIRYWIQRLSIYCLKSIWQLFPLFIFIFLLLLFFYLSWLVKKKNLTCYYIYAIHVAFFLCVEFLKHAFCERSRIIFDHILTIIHVFSHIQVLYRYVVGCVAKLTSLYVQNIWESKGEMVWALVVYCNYL